MKGLNLSNIHYSANTLISINTFIYLQLRYENRMRDMNKNPNNCVRVYITSLQFFFGYMHKRLLLHNCTCFLIIAQILNACRTVFLLENKINSSCADNAHYETKIYLEISIFSEDGNKNRS